MGEKIEPALTAEEWARIHAGEWHEEVLADLDRHSAHARAALALHGQPFGFTREDVELLRKIGPFVDRQIIDRDAGAYEWLGALMPLADRIEALLPPALG